MCKGSHTSGHGGKGQRLPGSCGGAGLRDLWLKELGLFLSYLYFSVFSPVPTMNRWCVFTRYFKSFLKQGPWTKAPELPGSLCLVRGNVGFSPFVQLSHALQKHGSLGSQERRPKCGPAGRLTPQQLQQAPFGQELRDDVHGVPHRCHGTQRQDVLVLKLLHGLDLRLEGVLVQEVVCGVRQPR